MKFFSLLIVLTFALTVFAAPKKKQSDLEPRTVEIDVPELAYPAIDDGKKRPTEAAVQISSWTPSKITVESRIPATEFAASLPQLSGHVLVPVARPSWAAISARVGLGYQNFERNGNVDLTTTVQNGSQKAHLVTGVVGVLVKPDLLTGQIVGANFEAKVIPAYLNVDRGAMSEASGYSGVGYEIALGLATNLSKFFTDESVGGSGVKLDLAAGRVFGTSDAMDFSGFNVRAGLRWSL